MRFLLGWVFFVCSFALASPQDPFLPLHSMTTAPATIQKAAQAIVRISTPFMEGTGFFYEKDRLVTNAHVIGDENCTLEGCFFKLDFNFQRGEKFKTVEVFGVPLFSDRQKDVTILKIFEPSKKNPKASKFDAPAVLSFAQSAPKLLAKLYIVGHAFGGLKRWSESQAFERAGDWCTSGHCCPPGNSGSPVLDEKGSLAGIVHRSCEMGNEILDLEGARHVAYFSVAEVFEGFLKKDWEADPSPTLDTFVSIPMSGKTKIEDEEDLDGIPSFEQMIARKLYELKLETSKERIVVGLPTLLLNGCKKEVADDAAAEDPDYEYESCSTGREFINCAGDKKEGEFCPTEKDRKVWQKLFHEIAEYRELKNSSDFVEWLLAEEVDFAPSKKEAREAALKVLTEQHKRHPEVSKFAWLDYVAQTSQTQSEMIFEGTDYWDALVHYKKEPVYAPYFEEIGDAVSALVKNEFPEKEKLKALYAELLSDPKMPVPLKAEIETAAYQKELLP